MGKNGNGYHANGHHANGPVSAPPGPRENGTLELHLTVSDPELYAAFSKRDGPARERLATAAMRIGVIALRQAQGQVDVSQVREAGECVIRDMSDALDHHRRETARQVGDCIKEYFDPSGGLFTQRVKGLIGQRGESGELERIIRRQVDGDQSLLPQTNSPMP